MDNTTSQVPHKDIFCVTTASSSPCFRFEIEVGSVGRSLLVAPPLAPLVFVRQSNLLCQGVEVNGVTASDFSSPVDVCHD